MSTNYDFNCVVITHGDRGVPHFHKLVESNPGLDISVFHSEGVDWYGSDRNFQNYALENTTSVFSRTLFLDYDVRVDGDLRKAFPTQLADVEGAYCVDAYEKRIAFAEVLKLPKDLREISCFLAPVAVLMLSKRVLDFLHQGGASEIFDMKIFCELRLPTVLRHAGFSIAANPALTHVKCRASQVPEGAAILKHPVKVNV